MKKGITLIEVLIVIIFIGIIIARALPVIVGRGVLTNGEECLGSACGEIDITNLQETGKNCKVIENSTTKVTTCIEVR